MKVYLIIQEGGEYMKHNNNDDDAFWAIVVVIAYIGLIIELVVPCILFGY